jgi:hypothetical protein
VPLLNPPANTTASSPRRTFTASRHGCVAMVRYLPKLDTCTWKTLANPPGMLQCPLAPLTFRHLHRTPYEVRPGQLSPIRPSRVGSDMDPDYPAAHACATALTQVARSDAVACRLIPLGRTRRAPLRNEKSSRSWPRRYDACPPGNFAAEAREACIVARQGTRNRNLCSAFPASPGVRPVHLTATPLADLNLMPTCSSHAGTASWQPVPKLAILAGLQSTNKNQETRPLGRYMSSTR